MTLRRNTASITYLVQMELSYLGLQYFLQEPLASLTKPKYQALETTLPVVEQARSEYYQNSIAFSHRY